MNMEWVVGFLLFSLVLWCARNELFIRQIKKESITKIWEEIRTLQNNNNSTDHIPLPANKIIYAWKEEVEASQGVYVGNAGVTAPLSSAWNSHDSKPIPNYVPSYTPIVPGKPGKVYIYDYIPLDELVGLMLEHLELKPTRIPQEDPKIFGLEKTEP
jgi:hypothetical protein